MEKKRPKVKKLLHLLWVLPLILLVTAGVLMYLVPACESTDRTAVAGSADWMARLDDGKKLSEVTLPGTHDAATKTVQLAYFSKCQALTVGEQLEAGYRYLDIRLGADGDRLKLMHGFTNCTTNGWPWAGALYLDAVLEPCYAFLSAHPTEAVVFAVKQEHGDETVAQFQTLLNAYVQKQPDKWLLTDHIPTVAEARGKLVLMRRYADEANLGAQSGIPLLWDNQSGRDDVSKHLAEHDNGSYTLSVQDRYEYEEGEKWRAFLLGVQEGVADADTVAIHFLSTKGSATYGHPFQYARALNLNLLATDTLSGWIVVDFGSAKIAQHIYETNF